MNKVCSEYHVAIKNKRIPMKLTLLTLSLFITTSIFAQQEFNLNEVYEIAQKGTIKLSSDDADVTVTGTDRKDVRVKVHRSVNVKGILWGNREFEVEVFSRNGNLVIQEHSSGSIAMTGYSKEVYTIDIEAPIGINLDIKGDDGDYFIQNMGGEIAMEVDDGDAELSGCTGNYFSFSFDDGDVKMDQGAGKLRVKTDDGDFHARYGNFEEIDAYVDDGSIEIATILAKNGQYTFDGNDADITVSIIDGSGHFDLRHDDTNISYSEAFNVLSEREDETILKLGDGSANVKIRTDDGRIRLHHLSKI